MTATAVGPTAMPEGLRRFWYVACRSSDLGTKPIARKVLGIPMVLFRGEGGPAALLDRCPHRSVPLSAGEVVEGQLRCAYHGWRFDRGGQCRHVPALKGASESAARNVAQFAVRESQGMVWVWPTPGEIPVVDPFRFAHADDPTYLTVQREVGARGSVLAMAENALDVPHTAFLHRGLFRNDADRTEIRCVVERHHDHVICEYIGERRPPGIVARILSPSGGLVQHWDRFFLPSVVEVEYRLGDENHIVLNGACTPVTATETRMFASVSIRSRIPGWLIRPIVQPLALRVFAQDAVMLELQTETIERFEEERYVSTEIDVLGPHIRRLLSRAERGEVGDPDAQPYRREVSMLV